MSRSRDFADLAGSADAGGLTGRNLIINGAMTVAQRGTSFTSIANTDYSLDRWQYYLSGAAVQDVTQSTDTPNNTFQYSYKADVTTADASVAAGDLVVHGQKIEGYNVAQLGWGTADAQPVTISFWVKSTKTGIHSVTLKNSAQDRAYAAEYTVNASDTWEYKTITISGDTSGTWLTTNGIGLQVWFAQLAGSTFQTTAGSWAAGNYYGSTNQVNSVDDAANNFLLCGVQLEVGETATPFEHEDYGTTLRKCARYYYKINTNSSGNTYAMGGMSISTTTFHALSNMAEMRTSPTALETNGTAGDYRVIRGGSASAVVCNAVPTLAFPGPNSANCYATVASGLSSSSAGSLQLNSTTAFLAWSAEL